MDVNGENSHGSFCLLPSLNKARTISGDQSVDAYTQMHRKFISLSKSEPTETAASEGLVSSFWFLPGDKHHVKAVEGAPGLVRRQKT